MFIDPFQEKIWKDKYQYNDETFIQFCYRIADNIFKDDKKRHAALVDFIKNFRGLFGGRINSNIGVDEEGLTLFNCFIESIVKNPDSLEGIMDMVTKYAITLKTEGGVGFCANFLRPAKTLIRKIGVTTPGAIKFLEIFDKTSEIITAGSVDKNDSYQGEPSKKSIRKGATMVTMNINHPDIEEFIVAKAVPNRLTKMNMSVLVTDAFMYAVKEDTDWDLWFPDINFDKYDDEWDGNFENWGDKGYPFVIYKTLPARELWNLLLNSTYNRNEPGIIFIDNARRMNNLHYLNGSMTSTNPCQPSWATVMTPNGIRIMENIHVGSVIWSDDGWTRVTNKVSSGQKKVYKYKTTASVFYGTENHKIVSDGIKVEVCDALCIDTSVGRAVCLNTANKNSTTYNWQSVVDGLLIGDGSVHKASNSLIYLCVGKNDKDYLDNSYLKDFILAHRPGIDDYAYTVKTTLESNELPLTFKRRVPKKYFEAGGVEACSFLMGLFSANGTVITRKGSMSVRLKAASKALVEDVQVMLSSLGIRSFITTNKKTKVKFDNGECENRESYDLDIIEHTVSFQKIIGFIQNYKNEKLTLINKRKFSTKEKISFEVVEKEFISEEEVFDITVDNDSHTYWTGGCNVSNCAEVVGHTGPEYYNGELIELGDVCNLGSINLTKYYDITENKFSMDEFKEDIDLMIRSLDNVIEISNYPLKMYEDAAKLKRKIGVGLMGVASLMMMSNIRYGSKECIDLLEVILSEFINQAYRSSAILAKEVGPFPLWDKKALQGGFIKHSGVLKKDTLALIKKHGLRHSAVSAIAPNGTLSIVAGNISGGLEPIFAKEFTRWNRIEGKKVDFEYPNIHKGEWFETDYLKEQRVADEVILISEDGKHRVDKNSGLCKNVTIMDYGYKAALKAGHNEFACATELSIDEHLAVLKVFSKYIDQSCSKCISLDSRINTDKGLVKLGSLSDNRAVDTFCDIDSKVLVPTEKGLKPVNQFYYNGEVLGKEVITKSGLELTGSSQHRIRVLNNIHELEWKRLDSLVVGDLIAVKLGKDISSEKTISRIVGKKFSYDTKRCKHITIPTQLTKNLLWWLGCIAADGDINSVGVHLSQVSGIALDKFIRVSEELFARKPVIVKDHRRDKLFTASINSKVLVEWFNYIGFSKEELSEIVFAAPKLLKKSFVEGVTLDGYVTDERVCLKTDKTERFIMDLQLICNTIGIPTRITKKFNTHYEKFYYNLFVYSDGVNKLSSFVFPEEHKQTKLLKLLNGNKNYSRKSFIDYGCRLPIDDVMVQRVSDVEKQVFKSNKLYNIFHRITNDAKESKSLTMDQLLAVYTFNNTVPKALNNNYLFTAVESVEDKKVITADIEVKDEHNYIANGFISHNTINLPADIGFENFKKLYGEIHGYGIKGCTTYRAGTSVAVLETQKKEKNKSIKEQQKEFLDVFKNQENGDTIVQNVSLPEQYPAKGFILKSDGGKKWYIHVAFKDIQCTQPFAIFVNTNNREDNVVTYNALEMMVNVAKSKGIRKDLIEEVQRKYGYQKNPVKICRMLGFLLRHNVDVHTIVMGLDGLGTAPGTFVFRIKKFLSQFVTKIGDPLLCPECGEIAIVFEAGCFECKNCGHTKC